MEVEGSSLMLLSRAPGVGVWELMALCLSRWYGVPELSSSAQGRKIEREEENLELKLWRRKTTSCRFIMSRHKNKVWEQMS